MENKQQTNSGFTDTFISKLKEQSFTIILLVGIMYYQNTVFTTQMSEYKSMINQKEDLILKLTDEERGRLLERTKYLQEQRDKYVEQLMNLHEQK
jgi:hypothetical protein